MTNCEVPGNEGLTSWYQSQSLRDLGKKKIFSKPKLKLKMGPSVKDASPSSFMSKVMRYYAMLMYKSMYEYGNSRFRKIIVDIVVPM